MKSILEIYSFLDNRDNQGVNPKVKEMNEEQSRVHDNENKKETNRKLQEEEKQPGEDNPRIVESPPNDPRRIDPTKEDERNNDHTRLKPGWYEPAKKDPVRVTEPVFGFF
jgi:hypothetical protein